jgi:hypothetical protein
MKRIILIAACLLSFAAHAQFATSRDLANALGSKNPVDQAAGLGYIMGVYDAGNTFMFCLPQTPTVDKLVELFVSGMESQPEDADQPGDYFIVVPLQRTFPCKQKSNGI